VPLLPGGWPRDSSGSIDPDASSVGGGSSGERETSVISEISDKETVTFDNLPATAECSVTELDSGGATGRLMWLGGVLQLGDITLAGGLNDSTLSNVFLTTLAFTGVEIMLWLWVIGALLFTGLVFVMIARRRSLNH
jgi:hypothetical protein